MRIARWVGAVGAVVYVVGFFLVSSVPGGGDVNSSDFEDFYVTDDNTSLPVIGMFVLTIGALALLWFFHDLRTAIGTSDAGFGWAAAALGLAVVVAGASLLAGPSGVQAFSDEEFVGQPVAHAFASAGFAAMLIPASFLLGLGVGVLSFTGRRSAFCLLGSQSPGTLQRFCNSRRSSGSRALLSRCGSCSRASRRSGAAPKHCRRCEDVGDRHCARTEGCSFLWRHLAESFPVL